MKKFTVILSVFAIVIGSSLFAAPKAKVAQQDQMTMQKMDCSQLSGAEQNFAAQMMDKKNKEMFCSQFTPDQRQKAMQMMGQPDASGNPMNADQAVMKVGGSAAPMSSPKKSPSSNGGCPVK